MLYTSFMTHVDFFWDLGGIAGSGRSLPCQTSNQMFSLLCKRCLVGEIMEDSVMCRHVLSCCRWFMCQAAKWGSCDAIDSSSLTATLSTTSNCWFLGFLMCVQAQRCRGTPALAGFLPILNILLVYFPTVLSVTWKLSMAGCCVGVPC